MGYNLILFCFRPDFDYEDTSWVNYPSMNSQLASMEKPGKQQWLPTEVDTSCWDNPASGAAVPTTLPVDLTQEDLDVGASLGLDNLGSTNFQEDELESWLQYPPDEPQEQQTSEEIILKAVQQGISPTKGGKCSPQPPPSHRLPPSSVKGNQPGSNSTAQGSSQRAANAAAALALGAQRAAGLIPVTGSEAFSKVRTSSLSAAIPTSASAHWEDLEGINGFEILNSKPLQRAQPASSPMNFAMFAKAAALHSRGGNTAGTNTTNTTSVTSQTAGSNGEEEGHREGEFSLHPVRGKDRQMPPEYTQRSSWQGSSALTMGEQSAAESERIASMYHRKASLDTTLTSSGPSEGLGGPHYERGGGMMGMDMGMMMDLKAVQERKKREREEDAQTEGDNCEVGVQIRGAMGAMGWGTLSLSSPCPLQDALEDSVDPRKQGNGKGSGNGGGMGGSKRSRAAAIHNLSERVSSSPPFLPLPSPLPPSAPHCAGN